MLTRLSGGPGHDQLLDLPMRRVRLGDEPDQIAFIPQAHVLVAVIDDKLVPLPPPGPTCRQVLSYAAGRWDTYTLRGVRQPRNDSIVRMQWVLPPERRARCLDAMTRIIVHFTTERAPAAVT
jgi:hypothetical protein